MTDKKKQILNAATRLFAEEGLAVPTARIAKEAGVSNGTLFNYFSTKQDLIDDVFFTIREKIANDIISDLNLNGDTYDILLDIWMSYINWAHAHHLEHQVLGLLRASKALSRDVFYATDHFFVIANDTLKKGQQEGDVKTQDIEYIIYIGLSALRSTIDYTLLNNIKGKNLEAFSKQGFELFWSGITTRPS